LYILQSAIEPGFDFIGPLDSFRSQISEKKAVLPGSSVERFKAFVSRVA
jgi:hypothetical protein